MNHAQEYRDKRQRQIALVNRLLAGYTYDPGSSDLDDEQPITLRITLGDYRELRHLAADLSYAATVK